MNVQELLQRIKEKGYWRVVIRPTSFEKVRIPTLSNLRELIQSCNVHWRGWDYPHWELDAVKNMQD